MNKEQMYNTIMRAIELIEEGFPSMAKRLLEDLANELTFRL